MLSFETYHRVATLLRLDIQPTGDEDDSVDLMRHSLGLTIYERKPVKALLTLAPYLSDAMILKIAERLTDGPG